MNRSAQRSLLLSQVCVVVFAVLLLGLDVGCWWLAGFFVRLRDMPPDTRIFMTVTVYLCSVFGWILLGKLWVLVKSIRGGRIFTEDNVRRLRHVCRCCVGAFAVCLVSAVYYLPYLAVAMAAGFMALLVHIIQNIFQQAIAMKDDLDLTI